MKRKLWKKYLSMMLVLALVICSIPISNVQADTLDLGNVILVEDINNDVMGGILTTTPASVTVDNTIENVKAIFANGSPIILAAGAGDKTLIYIDNNANGKIDDGEIPIELTGPAGDTTDGYDLTQYWIFGGSNDTSVDSTKITMLGGKVSWFYGGGNGGNGTVNGNVSVTISGGYVMILSGGGNGGTVDGNIEVDISGSTTKIGVVIGGGYFSDVKGNVNMTVSGGEIFSVFENFQLLGGGFNGKVNGDINLNISGGKIYGIAYGGTYGAEVGGNINSVISNITGVFLGGGFNDYIHGNTTVTVGGNANIVYGGGSYILGNAVVRIGVDANISGTLDVSSYGIVEGTDSHKEYEVAYYDSKAGTKYGDGTFQKSQWVREGQSAIEPVAPEMEGKTFAGWKKVSDDSVYDFSSAVTEPVKLYATWTTTPAPVLTAGSVSRDSASSATVKFTSTKAGNYFYAVEPGEGGAPDIAASGAEYIIDYGSTPITNGVSCEAGENTINLTNLEDAASKRIFIIEKDSNNKVSNSVKIIIPAFTSNSQNGSVTGIITDDKAPANKLSGVNVVIKQGESKIGEMTTDENGKFSFSNLAYGTYSLVAVKGEQTVTKIITVSEIEANGDMILPVIIPQSYSVKGTITDDKSPADKLSGVTVTVKRGESKIGETTTDEDGRFSFSNLAHGTYSLVAAKGEQTVTKIITVSEIEANGDMTLPSGQKNTVVITKPNTPPVAAEGLNSLFTGSLVSDSSKGITQDDLDAVTGGGKVEVKLTAQKKEEAEVTEDASKLKIKAGNGKELMLLDLTVTKTVNSGTPVILTELNDMIEIVVEIPDELKGKNEISILRVHDGVAETLSSSNIAGEHFTVNGNYIHIFVKKFSTYAIAYDKTGGSGNGGGSGSGGSSGGGNNAGSGSGESSSSSSSNKNTSSIEEINVDVTDGNSNNLMSQTKLERTTTNYGTKKGTVNYTENKAKETIEQLRKKDKDVARIVISDTKYELDETKVNILSGALSTLASGNVNLEINTENARISLPKQTVQELHENGIAQGNEDLYFRLVPIKDEVKKQEIQANANKEAIVKVVSGNNSVQTLGKPIAIETNMSGRQVDITLPLKDINIPTDLAARDAFLKDLGIYIEHSDGTKEFVKGEIVEYESGVYGIKFSVTKFSNFTIVKLNQQTLGNWKNSEQGWKYIVNGQPTIGWKQINGVWYLMDSAGIMQTGWSQDNGVWYLLRDNGSMATGWAQLNGLWYYLNSNGAMATGWINLDGKWYYLYGDGSLAISTVVNGYSVDENGAWIV